MTLPAACTILVVEDDKDSRESVRILLENEGYCVATVTNGQEALDYLRAHPAPNVVLLDLMMPVKDGWQFLAERSQDPDLETIPVIVCSAVATLQDAIPGAQAILNKPYEFDQVVRLIQQFC